jgi:putative ABC transport system permease protein
VIRVALKGLAGRKFRAALTAIAIVLGVAMISGTYILTDTIDKAFHAIFAESYAGTDAVITGKGPDISFQGDTTTAPPVSASLLPKVRSLPDVEAATGQVIDDSAAKIIGKNGKVVDTQGAPALGFGIDPNQTRFNPLKLVDGTWPTSSSQVVIDKNTADDQGFGVGSTVRVASLKPVEPFRVVGIAKYGGVDSIGSATFAVFTLREAQRLFDREGQYDAISVAAKQGISQQQLADSIGPILPSGAKVETATQQAQDDASDVSDFTSFIRYFLLAFAGIALFVGAFVIFNTLSITVAQRAREFATMRTIGASRRQILMSVVLEAFIIGLISSVIGLFLGLALASGLNALFKALSLDLPTTGLVFATRTVVVSLLVGVIVTLLAGLAPAVRATRVPPIAAVREGATVPRGWFSRHAWIFAVITTAVAVLLLGYGLFGNDVGTAQRLLSIAVGCLSLFVGVALLSPRLVRPLAWALGWPASRIAGAAGQLARGNSRRNPGRTAATAAALMIGIALVTFVAVLAEGMRASNSDAIERQVIADYVVTSQDGFTPFVASAGSAAANAPGVTAASDVRSELGKADNSGQYITGLDPATITKVYRFDWQHGSNAVLGQLGGNGAILSDDFADQKDLKVGSRFQILSSDGRRGNFVVRGIYQPPPFYPLLGAVSINTNRFDTLYERPRNQFTFINGTGGTTSQEESRIEQALAPFPDAKVLTRQQWIADQEADLNQFLNLLYLLLALSVVVSLFGMVNTLVLSVFERTRELGMLRAVGMTRRQVRRMVRHESVITALIGAALGLPLGIFLAALVTQALSQFELQFSIPVGTLLIFVVVAIIAGLGAAVVPARRAARLNVLQALQYE